MSKMSKINMLVCITGEIGSGKTTAINFLRKKGYQTFVMDDYIHHIYNKNQVGYALIKKNFGEMYVNSKQVNRKKLGQLVFLRREKLNLLNKLMIPLMQKKLQELKQRKGLLFVELGVYIHYPNQFNNFFDKVIIIRAKKSLKKSNLKKKMPYLKKFPTISVGKLNLYSKNKKNNTIFVVENDKNLNFFKKTILNVIQK